MDRFQGGRCDTGSVNTGEDSLQDFFIYNMQAAGWAKVTCHSVQGKHSWGSVAVWQTRTGLLEVATEQKVDSWSLRIVRAHFTAAVSTLLGLVATRGLDGFHGSDAARLKLHWNSTWRMTRPLHTMCTMCIDKSRYGNATSWHFCCKHVWQHTLEWKWDSETAVYTSHINRFSVCSEAQTTQNNLSAHILSLSKLPCWPFLNLVGINIVAWIVHVNRDPDNYADFSSCSAVMMWNKVNWEVRELDKFPQWRELIATFLTVYTVVDVNVGDVSDGYLVCPWNHPGWAEGASSLVGSYLHCLCMLRRRKLKVIKEG